MRPSHLALIGLGGIGLALCLATGLEAQEGRNNLYQVESQLPIRWIIFGVPGSARPQFFERLTSFAVANGFIIRIAPIAPNGEQFSVQLLRHDIKVFGDNSLEPRGEFALAFYQNSLQPVAAEMVEQLMIELKKSQTQVQDVIVIKTN